MQCLGLKLQQFKPKHEKYNKYENLKTNLNVMGLRSEALLDLGLPPSFYGLYQQPWPSPYNINLIFQCQLNNKLIFRKVLFVEIKFFKKMLISTKISNIHMCVVLSKIVWIEQILNLI